MWTYKIIYLMLLLLVSALANGCTADISRDPGMQEPVSVVRLRIDVVLDNSLSTRTPEGPYDPGIILENYIDIENRDFRVLFFDRSEDDGTPNKYIGTFKNSTINVTDETNRKKYSIEGEVDNSMLAACKNGLKVVLLANWKEYPAVAVDMTTINDLATASSFDFNIAEDIKVDETHHIPMIGILDKEKLEFTNNGDILVSDLGTLHMLRAYAKIEVTLSGTSKKKLACAPVLTKVNKRGYKFPLGVTKESDYKKNSYDKDYTSYPSIPEDTETVEKVKMVQNSDSETSWLLYVPEFQNLLNNNPLGENERARIEIKFQDIEQTYYVDFKYYDTPPSYVTSYRKGDHFNILRNNWYIFEVSKQDEDFNVTVDIQPFAEKKLVMDYGLMRDERGDLKVQEGTTGLPKYFTDYMTKYPQKWPKVENGTEDLKIHTELDDYYAIVLGADGLIANAEVWLKDRDGMRIMTNFAPSSETDPGCSTREVIIPDREPEERLYKDIHGENRVYHFPNHWSIVLDKNNVMYFKNRDNTQRFKVESFDMNSGECYIIISEDESAGTVTFEKIDKNGERTKEFITYPPSQETE